MGGVYLLEAEGIGERQGLGVQTAPPVPISPRLFSPQQ